jgi:predicted transcriptional regulator
MERSMTKDVSVTLRMSQELKNALQRLALEDRRTLSAYIEKLLEDHVAIALQKLAPGAFSQVIEVHEGQTRRHSRGTTRVISVKK